MKSQYGNPNPAPIEYAIDKMTNKFGTFLAEAYYPPFFSSKEGEKAIAREIAYAAYLERASQVNAHVS